jgi:hypothetical protein
LNTARKKRATKNGDHRECEVAVMVWFYVIGLRCWRNYRSRHLSAGE